MNSKSSVFVLSAILLISGSQAICQTIPLRCARAERCCNQLVAFAD